MRIISLLSLMIILTACASSPAKNDLNEKLKNEFVSELLLQKITENGEHFSCDQPNYQKCLQVTQQECIDEAIPFKEACFEKAKSNVPAIGSRTDSENFLQAYMICMLSKQMIKHSSKMQEIGDCMKNIKFDKDIGTKSIFK